MQFEQSDFNTHVGKFQRLEIIEYPSAILKKKCEPVKEFNDELKKFCTDMLFTMYQAPGIGLAANQVGMTKRIFVVDVDFERKKIERADGSYDFQYSDFKPQVFINPKITILAQETEYEEGCLSLPGVYEKVKRSEKIKVHYQDINGDFNEIEAEGLLAVCIQHENDHLDGKVFLDRVSFLKRNFYLKKFSKNKRRG